MQILPWVKMGHFCTTSFAREKKLHHQDISYIDPIPCSVAINHLTSFFFIWKFNLDSSKIMSICLWFYHYQIFVICPWFYFIFLIFRDKVLEMNSSPNGFCQARLLSINCANMQNCFFNVDSTDLPKPSSANLPHLLSIYAEMVPLGVLVKGRQKFFVLKLNNFVWVRIHYNILFWPLSHNLNDHIQSKNRTAQWA